MPSAAGPTVARNSFWLSLDSVLSVLVSMVASIAVARAMGPTKLGHYAYALWITSVTGTVASLGVGSATRKYAGEAFGLGNPSLARRIIDLTLKFQVRLAAVVVAVGLALVLLFAPVDQRLYLVFAVLAIGPALVLGIPTSAMSAANDVRFNVRASMVSMLVNLAGIALTLLLGLDLPGLTASLLVSRCVDLALRWSYMRRLLMKLPAGAPATPGLPPELRQRIVRFCAGSVALLALNVVVWDRSEMFFLARLSPIEQVAFFSLSFNISQSLLMFPRAMAWSTGHMLVFQQGRDPASVARLGIAASWFMAILVVPAAFGLAAVSEPVVGLVYGSRYAPAALPLAILSVCSVAKALMLPAQQIFIAADRQSVLIRVGLVGALVDVSLALWLIPSTGALGAAIANGLTQGVAAAALWWVIGSGYQAKLPLSRLATLFAGAILMFGIVRLAIGVLPARLALPAGVPLGAILFFAWVRATALLDDTDLSRLNGLASMVPYPLSTGYRAALRLLAGSRARVGSGLAT